MIEAISRLKEIVGPVGWIAAADDVRRYTVDYRGVYRAPALLVLRPVSTAEVAAIVAVCAEAGIRVVPQGGNTSLVGGAVPSGAGTEIVLSLERMNRIRAVAPLDATITVEAGCTLAAIQAAASDVGRLFPLRLGSEGTCQIGGNLSTNAGGSNVLRYGNARDLVLGLEVVLPDGSIWDGLRALRKDNTGYDLKQLFVGAEGTLGIITAAVLKLSPQPKSVETAFLAIPDTEAAVALLDLAKTASGDLVTAFELMSRASLELALPRLADIKPPLPLDATDWFVLLELSSGLGGTGLKDALVDLLAEAHERHLLLDAAVASSMAQAEGFWRLREEISDAQTAAGGSIRCDIAVPISRMSAFIAKASAAVRVIAPDARIIAYGHVGDGNVHFNPLRPAGVEATRFVHHAGAITRAVDDIAHGLGGSISAEHGVGQMKRDELPRYKSPVELALYRSIKQALDPHNLMNPGKLVPNFQEAAQLRPGDEA